MPSLWWWWFPTRAIDALNHHTDLNAAAALPSRKRRTHAKKEMREGMLRSLCSPHKRTSLKRVGGSREWGGTGLTTGQVSAGSTFLVVPGGQVREVAGSVAVVNTKEMMQPCPLYLHLISLCCCG